MARQPGEVSAALQALLTPRTLAGVAEVTGQSLAETRLLLGYLVNEGRVMPDGSGGYTLHPRERHRQEALARAMAERAARRTLPMAHETHVRTLRAPDLYASAPRRIAGQGREDWHGDED